MYASDSVCNIAFQLKQIHYMEGEFFGQSGDFDVRYVRYDVIRGVNWQTSLAIWGKVPSKELSECLDLCLIVNCHHMLANRIT